MSLSATSFGPVEETLHGVQVRDPYRWLEDRSLPETEKWIGEQQERCEAYFLSCNALGALETRVESFLNVEVVDQPARVGSCCFYRRRNKGQEQACIYVKDDTCGSERLLVDPSSECPLTSVGIHRISDDASLLAYEVKHGGGDKKEVRIVDVRSGQALQGSIGSGYARGFVFASANDGFYYCQELSAGTADHLIRFHSFSRSSADRVIFSRPHVPGSRLGLIADTVHLGAIWIHGHGAEPVCDFFVASRERDGDWRPVFVNRKLPYGPILHRGLLFVLSYEGALNGQIVALRMDGREVRTVVPASETSLRQIAVVGGRIFVNYHKNGRPSIHSWTLEGRDAGDIELPSEGTIQILPQLSSPEGSFFYTHESFAQPPSVYEYSIDTEKSSVFNQRGSSPEVDAYEVRELWFAGKDGTAVPVTLVARNEIAGSGTRPVIMTGYGGFGVSMTPQFSVLVTIMLDLGAVFALPHIRGGGEFGKSWHDAGRARNRQTSIDDFISAAEWLCAEGITTPTKLAIFGGSNSGLLVAAALTQRPDLFCAVLCIAPLLDMVRYERFDQAIKWRVEYGSVENKDDFHALYGYSPYHHVRSNVNYPSVLFVSGDQDDRCNPAHVRKMASSLQGRVAQTRPILVDYNKQRGHSPVLPLSMRIEALARRIAFLCNEMKIPLSIGAPHETICY